MNPMLQPSARVAAQIAAGEVVERHESVVNELIENAINAGTSRIRIEITDSGTTSMTIRDGSAVIPANQP